MWIKWWKSLFIISIFFFIFANLIRFHDYVSFNSLQQICTPKLAAPDRRFEQRSVIGVFAWVLSTVISQKFVCAFENLSCFYDAFLTILWKIPNFLCFSSHKVVLFQGNFLLIFAIICLFFFCKWDEWRCHFNCFFLFFFNYMNITDVLGVVMVPLNLH